jgi:hypothetical protein
MGYRDDFMEEEEDRRYDIDWDIRREGRRWTGEEFHRRADCLIELKLEIWDGKLFMSEAPRRAILGMLLENEGMDAVVRMGDPALWKQAIDALQQEQRVRD